MVIYLVGFMGCGKSSVGRRVAKRLGFEFADTDSMVEEAAGASVPEIFARDGEEAFRRMESEVLCRFDPASNTIVATGGGAACSDANIEAMKSRGRMIYFRLSADRLFERLQRGRHHRPKIADMDDASLMEYISSTLAMREPFYSQASMAIDCDGVSDEYIADHIRYYIEAMRYETAGR